MKVMLAKGERGDKEMRGEREMSKMTEMTKRHHHQTCRSPEPVSREGDR